MSFDFISFRRLLFQNALDDAIDMLAKHAPADHKPAAEKINDQLAAIRSSRSWVPFKSRKRVRSYEKIIKNLYQSGLAISKGEPPPELIAVNPWPRIILGYALTAFLIGAGLFFFLYNPPCPRFDENAQIKIIVDKFGTVNQPLLQKIGLDQQTLERNIVNQLKGNGIDVVVHKANISRKDVAKAKCDTCNATMLIWGGVEYGDSVYATLNHYLAHESYDNYILSHDIPGAEENYKNVFRLQTSAWIGEIQCLIKLFQALMAKEKYYNNSDPQALADAGKLFTELSTCSTDLPTKIFALHCKGWVEMESKDSAQALITYDEILRIDSNNTLALNNSALLYKEKDSPLHAHARYERLLIKNDIPYIRIANAEVLTELDRKEEADKEIKRVRGTEDYKARKEVYETKIRTIPAASLHPQVFDATAPSSSLSVIATQFNEGNRTEAIRNLDILTARADTQSYTVEDLVIMRELYKRAGATERAGTVTEKATDLGVRLPPSSPTFSKAVRRTQ